MPEEPSAEFLRRLRRVLGARFRGNPVAAADLEEYAARAVERTLGQGYRLDDPVAFPYAVRCAVNAVLDEVRHLQAVRRAEALQIAAGPAGADPLEEFVRKDLVARLLAAIPARCRDLFSRLYVLGCAIAELVPEFGPNAHAVSQAKQRCLENAREAYGRLAG